MSRSLPLAGSSCVISTATIFSFGSAQKLVWYAPPHEKVPGDPGSPIAPTVSTISKPRPKPDLPSLNSAAHGVRRHQLDGLRPEDAHAVQLTTVHQHLQEPRVVGGRRQQPRPAGEALARAVHVIALAEAGIRRPFHRQRWRP